MKKETIGFINNCLIIKGSKCANCQKDVNIDNLHTLSNIDGKFKVYCSAKCYNESRKQEDA